MDQKNVLTSDDIQIRLDQQAKRRKMLTQVLPFTGLMFLFILFTFTTHGKFLDVQNFEGLVNQCFTLTIIAVGAAFIFSAGMLDMSVGAVLALSQLLMAYILRGYYAPVGVAVLVGIVTAVVCFSITAIVHIILRVHVFIVSLCMMNICTGILTLAVSNADVYIPYSELAPINNSTVIKLIALIMVIGLGVLIFNFTRLGKDLKAIGANPMAARQSGVSYGKSIWLSFVMLGISVGIASFFTLIRAGAVNAASGSGIQLSIIVAIVIGGFPLAGGANSKVWAPIIGAIMVTVLTNGLVLMGLDPAWGIFARGLLFLFVVALTYEKSKGKLVQ